MVSVLLEDLVLRTRKTPHCAKMCGFGESQQKKPSCRFDETHGFAGLEHTKALSVFEFDSPLLNLSFVMTVVLAATLIF